MDYWVYASVAVLVPVEPEPPAGRLGPLGEGLLQGGDAGLAVEKNQGDATGLALLKSYPISVLRLKLFPWPLFWCPTRMYRYTVHLVRGTSILV